MEVRYIGETEKLVLTNGKIYEVTSIEKDWYRIFDDTREDYLYPPELFEIVSGSNEVESLKLIGEERMKDARKRIAEGKW